MPAQLSSSTPIPPNTPDTLIRFKTIDSELIYDKTLLITHLLHRSAPPMFISPIKRPAFSLVELLIVIAVVAVLLSLLMPSLAQARLTAKRVQAMANVRSLVQGYTVYTHDNKGFLYPGYTSSAYSSPSYLLSEFASSPVDHRPVIAQYNLSKAARHPMAPSWPDVVTLTGNPKSWPYSYWPGFGAHSAATRACAMPLRTDAARPNNAMFSEAVDYTPSIGLASNYSPRLPLGTNVFANGDVNCQAFSLPLTEIFGTYVGKIDGSVELRKMDNTITWVTRATDRQTPNWQK